jgi:hypothetical protein
MIAAARDSLRELCAAQNPAYRLIRHSSIGYRPSHGRLPVFSNEDFIPATTLSPQNAKLPPTLMVIPLESELAKTLADFCTSREQSALMQLAGVEVASFTPR